MGPHAVAVLRADQHLAAAQCPLAQRSAHALVGGVTHLLSSSMCAAENCVDGGALGGREWRQLGEPVQMCPSFSLASIHTAADYCYLVELPGIEPGT